MLEFLSANLAAIIAGGSGLTGLIGFLKWYITFKTKERKLAVQKKRIPDMLEAFQELYECLAIPIRDGAIRVSLFKTSNGGSVPRIGTPLYITAVAEDSANAPQRRWAHKQVEDEYIRMLIELLGGERATMKVDSLARTSELRDHYERDGIEFIDIWNVCQTQKELYYLIIGYSSFKDSAKHRDGMRGVVNQIKNILHQEIAATGEK